MNGPSTESRAFRRKDFVDCYEIDSIQLSFEQLPPGLPISGVFKIINQLTLDRIIYVGDL
jgi:hypothetical protein